MNQKKKKNKRRRKRQARCVGVASEVRKTALSEV
jgi:hypothetical protein